MPFLMMPIRENKTREKKERFKKLSYASVRNAYNLSLLLLRKSEKRDADLR